MTESAHCCDQMTRAVTHSCSDHPNRYDCPDCLIDYSARFDEYGFIIHDGGSSVIGIRYCPWCGSKLPDSKRDQWFDELEDMGITDPRAQEIPEPYLSDKWYRTWLDLLGRRCQALVAREFWMSGELVNPFCVVFLTDDNGVTWRLYLNDENKTWELQSTNECPIPGSVQGDDGFRYPIVNLLEAFPVQSETIQEFCERDARTCAEAVILFASGRSLVFRYDYATETTTAVLRVG